MCKALSGQIHSGRWSDVPNQAECEYMYACLPFSDLEVLVLQRSCTPSQRCRYQITLNKCSALVFWHRKHAQLVRFFQWFVQHQDGIPASLHLSLHKQGWKKLSKSIRLQTEMPQPKNVKLFFRNWSLHCVQSRRAEAMPKTEDLQNIWRIYWIFKPSLTNTATWECISAFVFCPFACK